MMSCWRGLRGFGENERCSRHCFQSRSRAVIEALARTGCNVTDAAADFGVPAGDLRRLLWANPPLQDAAFEVVEARIDMAEKNIHEALTSDDSRRRDAASFFVVRNSARAKRRGWLTSASARVDMNVGTDLEPRRIVISWLSDGDELDDDGKLIEADPIKSS